MAQLCDACANATTARRIFSMMSDARYVHRDSDYVETRAEVHADAHMDAEDSLWRAAFLTNHVFHQLTTGTLTLTAAEADEMHTQLQELVLQAAAIGGYLREQQAWQSRWNRGARINQAMRQSHQH
jgi:hypothetical protein